MVAQHEQVYRLLTRSEHNLTTTIGVRTIERDFLVEESQGLTIDIAVEPSECQLTWVIAPESHRLAPVPACLPSTSRDDHLKSCLKLLPLRNNCFLIWKVIGRHLHISRLSNVQTYVQLGRLTYLDVRIVRKVTEYRPFEQPKQTDSEAEELFSLLECKSQRNGFKMRQQKLSCLVPASFFNILWLYLYFSRLWSILMLSLLPLNLVGDSPR